MAGCQHKVCLVVNPPGASASGTKEMTMTKTTIEWTATEEMQSYAPMFNFGDTETAGNAQRFGTYQEAHDSAEDRFRVWTMPTGFHVIQSPDPVNYRREDNTDISTEA
tara:strand:- start:424 stop:747 length:324 start_codon:yes stop_codon:yes gene_type:complete